MLFDDDKVSIVDEHELSKFFGNDPAGEGYVFFYETVDLDKRSVGLPEKPPPQTPLAKEEEETSGKGSYLKKKGSFSAPPSPNLTPLTSASKVNSTTKLNQVMTADSTKKAEKDDKERKEEKSNSKDKNKGQEKEKENGKTADVRRSASQSSRKSLNMPFGLGADRVNSVGMGSSKSKSNTGSSTRRPSSSGSLFSKKERVSSRPSTSHGSSSHENERSWFGSLRMKSMSSSSGSTNGDQEHGEGYIPPEIPSSSKHRVRSESNPHKASEEVKRNRRRSHTYSSASNRTSDTLTNDAPKPNSPSSTSQFASGMSATFMKTPLSKDRSVSHGTSNANPRNGQISPPPPLMSGKLSAAHVRREREQLERERYARMKESPQPSSPPLPSKSSPSKSPLSSTPTTAKKQTHTHSNNDIGSSPMTPAHSHKPAKKNIFSKWIDKIRH